LVNLTIVYSVSPTLSQEYILTTGNKSETISFYVTPYAKGSKADIVATKELQTKFINQYLLTVSDEIKMNIFDLIRDIKSVTDNHTKDVSIEELIVALLETINFYKFYDFVSEKIEVPEEIKSDEEIAKISSSDERKTTYSRVEYTELIALTLFYRSCLSIYLAAYRFIKGNSSTTKKPSLIYGLAKPYLVKLPADKRMTTYITTWVEKTVRANDNLKSYAITKDLAITEIITRIKAEVYLVLAKYIQGVDSKSTAVTYMYNKATDNKGSTCVVVDNKIGESSSDDTEVSHINHIVTEKFTHPVELAAYGLDYILRDMGLGEYTNQALDIISVLQSTEWDPSIERLSNLYPLTWIMHSPILPSPRKPSYTLKLPGNTSAEDVLYNYHASAICLCRQQGWSGLELLLSSNKHDNVDFEFSGHSTSLVNVAIDVELSNKVRDYYIVERSGASGHDAINKILKEVDTSSWENFLTGEVIGKNAFSTLKRDIHLMLIYINERI